MARGIYKNPIERGIKISDGLKKAYREGRKKINPKGINKILAEKLYLKRLLKIEKIKMKCQYCGEKFEISKGDKWAKKRKFCSQSCANKANLTPERTIGNLMKGKPSWNRGKKFPERSGENHPNWKGGNSRGYKEGYWSTEYKKWRKSVFKRDNYTCQVCRKVGGYLTSHHIKSWARFPKLRFNINNGVTLCEDCHKLTDNYSGRGNR